MKVTLKQATVGFLLWEGYWAYSFFSASNPDERMDTVFALLMAVVLPVTIFGVVALSVLAWRLGRRRN